MRFLFIRANPTATATAMMSPTAPTECAFTSTHDNGFAPSQIEEIVAAPLGIAKFTDFATAVIDGADW